MMSRRRYAVLSLLGVLGTTTIAVGCKSTDGLATAPGSAGSAAESATGPGVPRADGDPNADARSVTDPPPEDGPVGPARAGSQAPLFTLPAADGAEISLAALLAEGPVVAVFYRGHW